MTDPSKVYLENGMCPFRKGPNSPPHKCDIHKNPPSEYTPGWDTGYYCSHGEWSKTHQPMAPCDPRNPQYNQRLWDSSSKGPMPRYNENSKKWIEPRKQPRFKPEPSSIISKGIMGLLPPIDYLGDKLYDLRKIDRLDEYDYNLPNDEERKKYFEEHREESEKLLRKKKLVKSKMTRKPVKKIVKKVIKKCRCKK